MKSAKTKTVRRNRPQFPLLSVRGSIFIYVLLCILTVLFSRSFFSETLDEGKVPGSLSIVVFLTVPAVLLVLFGITVAGLLRDIIAHRPGVKFKTRLLGYFILIVVFAAAPITIVTGISINEISRYWKSVEAHDATAAARSLAVDNFSFHLKNFENILKEAAKNKNPEPLPKDIVSIQDFHLTKDGWTELAFWESEPSRSGNGRLDTPPSVTEGHVVRELPRDFGVIRYVMMPTENIIRLYNYDLGGDFDRWNSAVENQRTRFEVIGLLQDNLQILLFFYYGVFFFPTLLMTVIIAISFTLRVTNPIVELTEATRRVAEGDFSIQILARRSDELGLLIRSFNAMVQDLEKSRAALVKAEKISIWQNMAQQLAHEIKNPLTPIKLSAERVLRRWQNDPGNIGEIMEDSMLAIIQETEGLSTLLNEFKTLSKPTEPSKSWTNLVESVEEVVTPYYSSYPDVKFDIEHTDVKTVIKIDKHRFSQVMTNLLLNAVDSMGGGGLIEIRSDIVKKRDVRFCRISVRDTGKGIPKEESHNIFTPYHTTKESGTGLGLPIVERIITDHDGAIWFNSTEKTGTTFFIDLPVFEGV